VKGRKSIVLYGGYPALDIGKPAVKIYLGLNVILYRVFKVLIRVQSRTDK